MADLKVLRAGTGVHLPRYDFASHRREADEEWVEPSAFILVDGILVLADSALRDLLDHRIFVDVPADLRLGRRLRRDLRDRGRGLDDVLRQYEHTVRPMHERFVEPSREHAELVVDGTRPIEANVRAVVDFLRGPPSTRFW